MPPRALLKVPTRTSICVFHPQMLGHAAPAGRRRRWRGPRRPGASPRAGGHFGQFGQRGQVAVHAEQSVGDDQPPAILACIGQQQAEPGNRRADRRGRRPARAGSRPRGWRDSCGRRRPRRRGRPRRRSSPGWRRSPRRTSARPPFPRTRPAAPPIAGASRHARSPAGWPRCPSLRAGAPRRRLRSAADRRPGRDNRSSRS